MKKIFKKKCPECGKEMIVALFFKKNIKELKNFNKVECANCYNKKYNKKNKKIL